MVLCGGPFEYQRPTFTGRAEVPADDDQVAVGCQAVQVAVEVIGADHIDMGFHAAAEVAATKSSVR